MKYYNFTKNYQKAVKKIAKENPDTIFCGSFALALNNKTYRIPDDLDIITIKNYFQWGNFYTKERSDNYTGSHTFMLDKNEVKCFSLILESIKINVFYNCNNKFPEYTLYDFDGIPIKIETPKAAIEAKKTIYS